MVSHPVFARRLRVHQGSPSWRHALGGGGGGTLRPFERALFLLLQIVLSFSKRGQKDSEWRGAFSPTGSPIGDLLRKHRTGAGANPNFPDQLPTSGGLVVFNCMTLDRCTAPALWGDCLCLAVSVVRSPAALGGLFVAARISPDSRGAVGIHPSNPVCSVGFLGRH